MLSHKFIMLAVPKGALKGCGVVVCLGKSKVAFAKERCRVCERLFQRAKRENERVVREHPPWFRVCVMF